MSARNRNSVAKSKSSDCKYSRDDFKREFPDDAACLDWLWHYLYADAENRCYCVKCDKQRKHHRITTRASYACDTCGNHVYPMAGTIFEHSSTSLQLWFEAIFLMSSTRCGVSTKHLERELGVTYKTAWRMFHQIRKLLAEENRLSGTVEVDETFVGGKSRAPYRGRSTTKKAAVFGMVERGGRVVAKVVPHTGTLALIPAIQERVIPATTIYSDEWTPYMQLGKLGYRHRRIHHLAKVYVDGDVHTNTIEGFWALLKRGISGAHHAVSRKYLQMYLDEFAFRYNHRKDERPMFRAFLENVRTASALASSTSS